MTPRHAGRATGPRGRRLLVLLPALLVALGGAVAFAAAVSPYASADEAAHVDYAWRVWHGELPVFEDGLRLAPEQGVVPPVQWTAQHPPLFYLLLAPVVGPLLDADRPVAAALAARGATAVLAVLAVLAVAWAARWVLGRRDRAVAATATVAASGVWLLRLGGAVYNDVLLVLVVTLLLGTAVRIIRLGRVTWPWLVVWSVLPAATALTRASGVPLAALAVGTVAVAALRLRRGRGRALLLHVVAPVLVAVAGAGWFYLRNIRLTGSWTGSHNAWAAEHLERVTAPVQEVLTDGAFWSTSFRQLGYAPGTGEMTNLVLLVVPALAAVAVVLVRLRTTLPGGADLLVAGLLVVAVAGTATQQALYTAGGGGMNGRYLAVLALPLAVAVAWGLTAWSRTGVAVTAVAAWAVLRGADLVADVRAVALRDAARDMPGLPPTVVAAGVAVALCGLVAWVVSTALLPGVRPGRDPLPPATDDRDAVGAPGPLLPAGR